MSEKVRRERHFKYKRRAQEHRKQDMRGNGGLVLDHPRRFNFHEDGPTDLSAVRSWASEVGLRTTPLTSLESAALTFYHDFEKRVEFEDDYLLAVNKLPGVNAHHGVQVPVGSLEIARSLRPEADLFTVTRLDTVTSGLLLMAKGIEVAQLMRQQFADGEVERMFTAFLEGSLEEGPHLDVRVGVAHTRGVRMSVVHPDLTRPDALLDTEKMTSTRFAPKGVLYDKRTDSTVTYVEIGMDTSLVHQARVVAGDYLDHSPVKDKLYGASENPYARRPLIHSAVLTFMHPASGAIETLVSQNPRTFRKFADHYRVVDPAALRNESNRE